MPDSVNEPDKLDWRCDNRGGVYLPVGIPPSFLRLIDSAPSEQAAFALRREVIPSVDEEAVSPEESADPLGEARYIITPHLVHQYANRVLLLATGRCVGYCRYCFRRSYMARSEGYIGRDELEEICAYLELNPGVQEILVSGGDPLSGDREELTSLLSRIRASRPDILVRLCTRAPVFAPELFTNDLLAFLRSIRPLWVIPHINHSAELGSDQVDCLRRIIDSGIPIQSQTVLLRGVNDTPSLLADLFHRLVMIGVKPGYLFQCDLAKGTSGFRVPLEQALAIWKVLRGMLSGLSLPEFAVDLPGGGGKFPLSVPALADRVCGFSASGGMQVYGNDGKVYTYPSS